MKDLARICRLMAQCTRSLFAADIILTLTFVGLVIAGHFWTGGTGTPSDAAAATAADDKDTRLITKADIDKAITGKALFRTSASMLKDKVVNELAQFELKGMSTRKGKMIAHVRDTKLKKLLTKKVGDTLGAYEILDIGANGITLKRGAETLVLSKG